MDADFEIIYLNEQPIEICYAKKIGFICTNNDSITMFNDTINISNEFTPKKTIKWTGVYGCAINTKNEIYISDKILNRVHKMRHRGNLENICEFGNNSGDLNSPHGIAIANDLLFVCDRGNKRLQVLNINLEFITSLMLSFPPISIKCSNKTIGICGNRQICFIDLETLEKEERYFPDSGRMNFIDSNFYVVSSKSTHIFDERGNFIETIEMRKEISENIENESDGLIFFHEDNFFISSASRHRFLKFKNKFRKI